MPQRTSKKAGKAAKTADSSERLRKALGKRTKGELIDALVELAREDRGILRRLDARFEVEAPLKERVLPVGVQNLCEAGRP